MVSLPRTPEENKGQMMPTNTDMLWEFIFLDSGRRLLGGETPFPGADECNYIDLANFIRGQEIKLVRYLIYAQAGLQLRL